MNASTQHYDVRSAIRAGVIGNLVDQLHIFLPVLALGPALPILYAVPKGSHGSSIHPSLALVVMALLIGRPVGAIIFGQIADRLGRTTTTQIAIGGTALSTLLLGLTPSVATVGSVTPWWILACRFAGGVFLAGEYSAAVPLAMEWSKPRLRGWFSGLIMSMAPLAQTLIALLTFSLLFAVGSDAYSHGVWRVSFFIGALASLCMLILYRRTVRDHPEVTKVRKNTYGHDENAAEKASKPSLFDVFFGPMSKAFWHMFVLMSGMWCMTQMVAIFIVPTLKGYFTASTVSLIMLLPPIAQGIAMAAVGHWSTFTGRRRMFIYWGIFAAITGPLTWYWAITAAANHWGAVIVAVAVIFMQIVTVPIYGPVGAYLAEGFTASVRSSGYGIAYSASIILPALYPYYLPIIVSWVGKLAAPMVMLVVGGLLVTIGALMGSKQPIVDEHSALQHEGTTVTASHEITTNNATSLDSTARDSKNEEYTTEKKS